MQSHFFRKQERDLLRTKLDEWDSLKGLGKMPDTADGDLYSPRDRLVDRLVELLLKSFPERDLTVNADGPLVWSQKERDTLHTRVRRFLYNTSARRHPPDSEPMTKRPKGISVLALFKQRYSKRILARRDRQLKGKEGANLLHEYNLAVQSELAEFKTESPDEFAELERTAEALREEARRPFMEQSSEAQQA